MRTWQVICRISKTKNTIRDVGPKVRARRVVTMSTRKFATVRAYACSPLKSFMLSRGGKDALNLS